MKAKLFLSSQRLDYLKEAAIRRVHGKAFQHNVLMYFIKAHPGGIYYFVQSDSPFADFIFYKEQENETKVWSEMIAKLPVGTRKARKVIPWQGDSLKPTHDLESRIVSIENHLKKLINRRKGLVQLEEKSLKILDDGLPAIVRHTALHKDKDDPADEWPMYIMRGGMRTALGSLDFWEELAEEASEEK